MKINVKTNEDSHLHSRVDNFGGESNAADIKNLLMC